MHRRMRRERRNRSGWLWLGCARILDAYQLPMLAITTVGFARATESLRRGGEDP